MQPEPVLNEDKDDFKGPEFRNRSKVKPDLPLPKKRPGIKVQLLNSANIL